MQIRWCTIKVQPLTLVNFKINKKIVFNFLSFTLQQISMKDYDIVEFAHMFYFNDQCQIVSRQQLIFLKCNLPLSIIKSESDRKRVCKFDGCGFVKKRWNPTDSKADLQSVI